MTAAAEPITAPVPPAQAPPALRVIADRAGLVAALTAAAAVVPTRTPRALLQCVRLTAGPGGLAVEATNLEQWVRHGQATVQVERPGAACVPAADLLSACRELAGDTLALETDERGENLIVRSESARVQMAAHPAGDFPNMAEAPPPVAGTLPAAALADMLRLARIAVAEEATRYSFNAVLLEAPKGKGVLLAAGTDGKRLALAEFPWGGPALAPGCLLPLRAVDALCKGMDLEADIAIAVSEREAAFTAGDFTLRTNLIEGQFPPYGDIIPKEMDKRLTADRAALCAALRQAGLGAGEQSKDFRPRLRLELGKAGLTAFGRFENREATSRLACKWEGADLTIGLNLEYLLDGLNALDVLAEAEEVSIGFTAPNRPILIAAPGFKYVLMPVDLL
jgi:DNA polymerase-3 subunit beta